MTIWTRKNASHNKYELFLNFKHHYYADNTEQSYFFVKLKNSH